MKRNLTILGTCGLVGLIVAAFAISRISERRAAQTDSTIEVAADGKITVCPPQNERATLITHYSSNSAPATVPGAR